MKAQQLKNAILQLAIQGKLVPQDPNDEPASVLLEKIKQEKENLIAEGKIKKSKKSADTPPYTKESEFPFEIPESWVWVRLGDIFNLQAGKYISAKEISPNIQDNLYACYGGNGIRGYVKSYNQEGSFPIIGRQGALCGNIHFATGKFYATEHAVVVNQFGHVDVQWAVYFLTQLNLNQYSTATAQPGLAVNKINNVYIPLPPLSEQKRIVAKIEELLPFIEQYAKKEQELTALHQEFPEQLKKSILQAAIQGKLTEQHPNDEPAIELVKRIQAEKERLILEKKIKKPKQHSEIIVRDNSHYEIVDGVERCIDDEIPFEIPESWCWVRLHQLGILSSGNTPKSEYLAHIGNIPYFKVSDMNTDGNEKYLIYTNHFLNKNYSGKLFSEDSIVFPKNGGAVFTNKKRILKFKSLVDLNTGVFTPSKINCFNYIFIMFNTLDFKKYYKGTALPTVDLNLIGNLLFPVPPLSEQKRIVAKIEQLFLSLENLG